MSINLQGALLGKIKPFGQLIIEGFTLAGIEIKSSGDADKYARAQAALKVAGIASSLASGDLDGAQTQISAILLGTADPGVAGFVEDLSGVLNPLLQAAATGAPLVKAGVQVAAQDIVNGITAVASRYPDPNAGANASVDQAVAS